MQINTFMEGHTSLHPSWGVSFPNAPWAARRGGIRRAGCGSPCPHLDSTLKKAPVWPSIHALGVRKLIGWVSSVPAATSHSADPDLRRRSSLWRSNGCKFGNLLVISRKRFNNQSGILSMWDSNWVFLLAPTYQTFSLGCTRVPVTTYYFNRYYVVPSKLSLECCHVQVTDWTGSDDIE